jgi:hypothetical protein
MQTLCSITAHTKSGVEAGLIYGAPHCSHDCFINFINPTLKSNQVPSPPPLSSTLHPRDPQRHRVIDQRPNTSYSMCFAKWGHMVDSQGADPQGPIPFLYAREGRQKSFEWGNYTPLPHGDRRGIQPNQIKFRTCSALAPLWTPPISKSAELAQGAL